MIIDCISDLHGYYPQLKGGDLLIIAGDLTARDEVQEYVKFLEWLENQKYSQKIVIGGNHDNEIEKHNCLGPFIYKDTKYLQDELFEYEGLKIWGSPWTLNFIGQNPKCKAFGLGTEEELMNKWDLIPNDTNILITHSPSYGILDKTAKNEYVGSKTLREKVFQIRPKIHVFGHIHECGGKLFEATLETKFINSSHVNERYNPVNDPVRVIL